MWKSKSGNTDGYLPFSILFGRKHIQHEQDSILKWEVMDKWRWGGFLRGLRLRLPILISPATPRSLIFLPSVAIQSQN
jgi:hypothetical protein